MANSGGGNKLVSANLNKSYGQNSHHLSSHSSSYGSSRTRPSGHGGGGGSMVVLSRPRSSQKAGPKLSVPPPLNLPSLRKEHERFDSLGLGSGPTGGVVSGSGSRPTSSGMGWTKPAAVALQEKESFGEQTVDGFDQGLRPVDGFSRGSTVYMPPSARSGVVGAATPTSVQAHPTAEKAAVLRGEDFPSLRATLSSSSGPPQKLKENLNQKQKQLASDNLSSEQKDGSRLSSLVDTHSQFHLSHASVGNGLTKDGSESHSFRSSRATSHARKQEEYFPGPLPLVRLNPRSDWADDERDTSHGLTDRSREGRDHGFSKNEAYWDRDFDMPRLSALPHKPALNFDKRGPRYNETGKITSSEVPKLDPCVRTASREGREGNSWRNSSFTKDGSLMQDVGNERNGVAVRPSSMNREVGKDNTHLASPFQENVHDDFGKKDLGYALRGREPWNDTMESYGGRGPELSVRDRYFGNEQHNRYSINSVQRSLSKSSFSLGSKGLSANDPLLTFNSGKHTLPKSEKAFLDDPFMKDFGASGFDGKDMFSAGLGVVKKKKDVLKQTDFHDPVRESFEAELERVQRMQEQERQRITEEQERALELARREEEDRLRQVREQEERQRRLEEEAREAAWRAEQEQIEALRKAEKQRIAREEEKKRIILEEERRKEAAKQKLLELEERIARRQAEAAKGGTDSSIVADEKMSRIAKEKDASKPTDMGDWDDSERVVERIITLASSDSSSLNRPLEIGSRPHFSRDISSTFVDRGKSANSWRRDVYKNEKSTVIYQHDQDNRQNTLRRDSQIGGKPLMKKEYYGGAEFMTSRTTHKGGLSEAHLNEYADVKGQRWNQPGVGDHLRRNTEIDSNFLDNFVERFGDGGTQGRSRGNSLPPYPEHASTNSESDEAYAYGRSRYSVRQPRVLPPPSITSVHKTYRNGNGRPGPSAFLENEIQYDPAARSESILPTGYDSAYKGNPGQSEVVGALLENNENENYKVEWNTIAMCDSQSSLSVSSPPSSPTHLSHDDLDEYRVSPAILASGEGKNGPLSGPKNESAVLPPGAGNENEVNSSCAISVGDDEEWTTEINEQFQEQEEYDEDEDYQEEYEVHDRDGNVDLNQEFEDMNLEEKGLPHMMDNLILGFDEGVQVGMPNEEFEGTLENEETSFIPQVSGSTLKEQVSFCNSCSDGEALEPVNSSPVNLNGSSSVFQESEKPTQYLVIKPSNSHTSMASENLYNVEAYNDDLAAHDTVPTSVTAAPYLSSDQTNMLNAATASSQVELPVKLQFGLFSGPSLIPSPVPAIQIGSIQMPLHVHPHFGVPHSHMHSSQPPLFQFGQLRYTSPISQGMMPLGSQSTSFILPNIPSGFSFTHNPEGPMPLQTGPDTIDGFIKTEMGSHPVDNQTGNSRHVNLSQGSLSCKNAENMSGIKQDQIGIPHDGNSRTKTSSTGFQMEEQGRQSLVVKSSNTLSNARESEGQPLGKNVSLQLASKEKDFEESKSQFPVVGGRGKRYAFTVKSSGSGSSGPPPRVNHQDTGGFLRRRRHNIQRTEFRVRDSAEKRVSSGLWHRKALSNKAGKQAVESACLSSATDNLQDVDPGGRVDGKESTKIQSISHSGLNHLKRNFCSGEVVDAPLQSGIIRVFEQPGIEAPSDADDFIEVRSKRQMLNDRREQREREIKAKSQVAKMSQKPRSTLQANCSKPNVSIGEPANQRHSDFVSSEGRKMAKIEVSSGFNSGTMSLSQPLAPIGTSPFKIDAQPDLRSQTSSSLPTSLPAVSGGGKNPRPGVLFESKNKVLDNVQTSMGSWDNTRISQQVMALAQRQLDEAMKPQQFDSRASPGELTATVTEPGVPTSSLLTRKKPFSTAASAINSLLAGEKIQFGAVTSPTVLPTSSHAVSHGVGPPRSSRSDMQISHNLAGCDNDCSLFFDKDKHSNESGGHLEDCEAEAAASAVAVAAFSIDEIVENGLGASSVSVSDGKGLGAADIEGIAAGVGCSQQSDSQSRSEEPLNVSLPADLSVETPPISLWPPLPSLQNSSSQMLMHFHGGSPHFPFYEMNPMIGGPVFAFGPHDESAPATQAESQKSSMTASGPIRSWQQCHSGVDSFCGPSAGFTGPFITPPGGIPGIQGSPHMVVYNHFAPVGQFGQAGLSFMGATYISSGKQPDWKHNSTSSAMGAGEGDMNNMNMAPLQQNPANMPTPYQHLAPGSPLLPIASPLAMFDVSPFQEGVHTSRCNHGSSVDHLISIEKFPTSQTSTPDGDRNFPNRADVNVNHLPDELGLVDPSNCTAAQASALSSVVKTQPVSTTADAAKVDVQNGNDSNSSNQNESSSQPSRQNNISTKQYDHSLGYTNYQRGGVSQKNSSEGEWSHRRMGFHGKNQTLGADKSFTSSKVKQIYVAKQTRSGTSMS